jgi:NADPH:quinone reductase
LTATTFEGRSWSAQAFGDPLETLQLRDQTWTAPSAGRVLVKVRACGVGLPDLLMIQGRYPLVRTPPVQPGQEVAGEVVAVATGSNFAVGDQVMGLTPFTEGHGGYGDYAYVREAKASRIPAGFTDAEAAGFMIGFRTAYTALIDRVPVRPGQTLAVLGASGSSGLAAIQLGVALGARVIAVASSADKLAFCTAIGADAGVNYRESDVGAELMRLTDGAGVDVIFDPVGGPVAAQGMTGLGRRGQLAVIGFASGEWVAIQPGELVLRNHSVVGVFAGGYTVAEDLVANAELGVLAAAGRIRTPVGAVHEFAAVPRVIQELAASTRPGKVIVQLAD